MSLVGDCRSCETSNVFLQSAPLKSITGGDFLFVAPHYVLAVICKLEGTLGDVDVEVVSVDN